LRRRDAPVGWDLATGIGVASKGSPEGGAALQSEQERASGGRVSKAKRIRAGMTHVYDWPVDDEPNTAFGGERASGLGRFGAAWALGGVHHRSLDFGTGRAASISLLATRGARPWPYNHPDVERAAAHLHGTLDALG
jgi:hypothetical protein